MATGELLASLDDINVNLAAPNQVLDAVQPQLQIDARRVIFSQLSGVFLPATIAAWTTPDNTPDTIRGIAGMLIAAKYYSRQVSGDGTTIPAFSQDLYNTAIAMLAGIRNGTTAVVDDTGAVIADPDAMDFSDLDFWPNNTTTGPYFVIDKNWA